MRKAVILISALALLFAVNYGIYQKERLLADGELVLMPLAPVDPRSLMQGDYMRLRYAVDRQIDTYDAAEDGFLVLDLDEHRVATLNRIVDQRDKADGAPVIRYRIRQGRLKLAGNTYFFQEGTSTTYNGARYGEFRIGSDGSALLTGVRDKEFNRLGADERALFFRRRNAVDNGSDR